MCICVLTWTFQWKCPPKCSSNRLDYCPTTQFWIKKMEGWMDHPWEGLLRLDQPFTVHEHFPFSFVAFSFL